MVKEMARIEFGKELIKLAKSNDFMLFNTDTKSFGLENFQKEYANRTFNLGIAEQNLFASAAGAALCGEKVYVPTFAVFASMRACEQLRTFICYPNLNVTVLASHGGLLTGADGATHIASEDLSLIRGIPNLTVVEPSDAVAARKLAKASLAYSKPLYIRFPKEATPLVNDDSYNMQIGKAVIQADYGNDLVMFAIGAMVYRAKEVAIQLLENGVKIKVVEIHTLKPIDRDMIIKCAKETRAVMTLEDNNIIGGLGSAVAEVLSENYPCITKRIGIQDCFGESGDPEKQYQKNMMDNDSIFRAALELMRRKEYAKLVYREKDLEEEINEE